MTSSLAATIRYRDNEFGGFEIFSVLDAVYRTFPHIIVCLDGIAWKDFRWFEEQHLQSGGKGCWGAMKIAMRDGIRRGPRNRFRFQAESGEIIFGWAGRDTVGFESD